MPNTTPLWHSANWPRLLKAAGQLASTVLAAIAAHYFTLMHYGVAEDTPNNKLITAIMVSAAVLSLFVSLTMNHSEPDPPKQDSDKSAAELLLLLENRIREDIVSTVTRGMK